MKIRLGILDSNVTYIKRLIKYFGSHYEEEIEIVAFSECGNLSEYLSQTKLDVILADAELVPENFTVPRSSILALFSDTQDIDTIRDYPAVCKYQKTEQLYRQILNLYAELDHRASYKMSDSNCPIILFMGAAGGVGTTTVAASCALNLTSIGFKVLYLNLESNGFISDFFTGEGQQTLSDVLYCIKSNHQNLALKLESMVRKDQSGVYFYEPFSVTLDADEMKENELEELLKTITQYGSFDFVVVDTEAMISPKRDAVIKMADRIFLLSDGTSTANGKLRRVIQEFVICEEREDSRALAKMSVIYNKCGRSRFPANTEFREEVFAEIDDCMSTNAVQNMREIAGDNIFDRLASR